MVQTLIIVTK